MTTTIEITRITILEIIRMRIFQFFAVAILITPIIALVFSNIFIFDIGKVRIDVFAAATRLLITSYILFVAVTLMGRDIGQKSCYQFLMPPVSRHAYLTGRFAGLTLCMLMLMVITMIAGELLIALTLSDTSEIYRHGITQGQGFTLAILSFVQHVSLLAMVMMICVWATGLAEMLVFSIAAIFLGWTLPPIIHALQNQEVMQHVPPLISSLTNSIGYIFPQLNGGDIAVALAHGVNISSTDILLHFTEHFSYALIMFVLALIIFSRRDL